MNTILVVDDESALCNLYEKELEEDGYSVRLAHTGEEALQITSKEPVDLVVLDIKLRDENGLEVLNQLRAQNTDTPIILNSAYSTYKGDFSSWLADAYVVKSSNLEELKGRIRELLSV